MINPLNDLAPIVLFVYNRPWHTQQTIEALQKNELAEQSDLIVYSDAPKNDQAWSQVQEVRDYLKTITGFKSIKIIEREENWGLAKSIITGVTETVNQYGKIIVLEDDLVTSPYFLKFMNEALGFYKDEEKVYSITGYSFSDDISVADSTYFLSITSSWGWATWKNKWQCFNGDAESLKKYINNRSNRYTFNFNNSYDFLSMAKNQLKGEIDSWAIFWYFSVLQKQGLTLYPAKSLVHNIGFDGSGVHCSNNKVEKELNFKQYELTRFIVEKDVNKELIGGFLRKNKRGLLSKIKGTLSTHLSLRSKVLFFQFRDKVKILLTKKTVGKNVYIDKSVHVTGWNFLSIGNNTAISENTWINVNNRVVNHKHIVIGENCYIGRRNFFSSGWLIDIGSFCMTGLDCKFMGSDHVFNDPMKPYISTGTTNDKVIKIETNVWLGANVTVVGNVNIGRGSVVGAGSFVNKDIPPFSVVVGNPFKVIKRFDFKRNEWVGIEKYDEKLDSLMPSDSDYLNFLKTAYPKIGMPLQACSKKFGDMF